MATIADGPFLQERREVVLSGTPRAHAIDRWIHVFTAASFIVIVLAGFVPDSLKIIAMQEAGQHPPFPVIMHVHAVLMGSFLLLLLTQTVLAATGRIALHRQLGLTAMVLVPALVVAGFILAPVTYRTLWQSAHFGPPPVQSALAPVLTDLENFLLTQIRVGVLFPLFMAVGLRGRTRDAGFHKRMMILGTAVALWAAFIRMPWLPTLPNHMLTPDLYVLLAVSPMFAWDVFQNRHVHRTYWVWLPIYAVCSLIVNEL